MQCIYIPFVLFFSGADSELSKLYNMIVVLITKNIPFVHLAKIIFLRL